MVVGESAGTPKRRDSSRNAACLSNLGRFGGARFCAGGNSHCLNRARLLGRKLLRAWQAPCGIIVKRGLRRLPGTRNGGNRSPTFSIKRRRRRCDEAALHFCLAVTLEACRLANRAEVSRNIGGRGRRGAGWLPKPKQQQRDHDQKTHFERGATVSARASRRGMTDRGNRPGSIERLCNQAHSGSCDTGRAP